MKVKSPAKLNLHLEVIKKRTDGFHELRTVFQLIDLYDEIEFLAQGTLYPDVIESGGSALGPAVTIKSHHNVGGLPEDMKFELIEPIRDLFKDEVRNVGR